jgi:hypothetical protein
MSTKRSKTKCAMADLNAMPIAEFCRRNRISKTRYYELQKQRLGPKEMRMGKTIRISVKSERRWVRLMELQSSSDSDS